MFVRRGRGSSLDPILRMETEGTRDQYNRPYVSWFREGNVSQVCQAVEGFRSYS